MSQNSSWRREWGLLVLVAVLALPLFTPRLYGADEVKYLTHLRSVYFDGDLDYTNDFQAFLERDPQAHGWVRELLATPTSTGRRLNDAPIGSALLWAPFYVAADVAVLGARAAGSTVARDGISWPYIWAICLGSLVWGLLGLALCYRICRLFFDRAPAQLAVIGVWLATGVVFYLYITPPMAHANSIFAVSLFLWLWLRRRPQEPDAVDSRSLRDWALLGAAAGGMVLVRELNWLLVAPLGVDELLRLWRRRDDGWWGALSARMPGYLAFAALLVLVVAPQFAVYRALHGTFSPTPFVVDKFSYPRYALDVLFSGFHGLFSWTPITLLATVGLGFLGRRRPQLAASVGFALLVQILVVGSYSTWWGGASFGARRFLNFTPVFALGLAALAASLPVARRRAAALVVALLVVWNFGLALQYATGMIPRSDPVLMSTIVRNQVTEVPRRAGAVAWRFLTDRWSLVDNAPPDRAP